MKAFLDPRCEQPDHALVPPGIVETQAGLQLLAVPFTPTYAEYIYLKGRRVLADQMEFLLAHIPRSSPLHQRLAKAEATQKAIETLDRVGLPQPDQMLGRYPHELSGGMRQRAMIAMALSCGPSLLIADEPTTALDVVVQRGVVQLLKDIQRKLENTIILVTHDMGVQANIADRVGIMYAGKMVEEATTEKIFGSPFHPYTQYLINSLPRFGDKTTRESVPGSPPSLIDLPSGCPFHPRCPYILDICTQQVPSLIDLEPRHKVACWLVGDG